jgi:hypothetical protein
MRTNIRLWGKFMNLSITSIRAAAKARSFFGRAACALAAMTLGIAPALAQDEGSMQVGNATVSVGAGTAILDLPDVQFFKITPSNGGGETVFDRSTTADDFSDEIGWNINGAITAPMTGANGRRKLISLSGFWANINDTDNAECIEVVGAACRVNALVTNPATLSSVATLGVGPSFGFVSKTEREVDQAGLALESKWLLTPEVMGVTQAPNRRYLALGLDWRAIYQDMSLRITQPLFSSTFDLRYNEDLDTNYYGAFAAYGGDYKPLFFKGLWERLGLQSSFRLQGGIYHADTDYSGSLRETDNPTILNSDATDSNNEIAFIGGLTLETRKQIGRRATLSLKSQYEYYSYVPSMNYNDNIDGGVQFGPNVGTTIGDDDAYSLRTSLRLTIKLGPDSVFEEPLK